MVLFPTRYRYIINDHPLLIHDLSILAQRAGLVLSEDQKVDFKIITGFNVSAKYDYYKLRIRKQATIDYTDVWMKKWNSSGWR